MAASALAKLVKILNHTRNSILLQVRISAAERQHKINRPTQQGASLSIINTP